MMEFGNADPGPVLGPDESNRNHLPPHLPSSNDSDCSRSSLTVVVFSTELIAASVVLLSALCYIVLKWIQRPSSDGCGCNCFNSRSVTPASCGTDEFPDKPSRKEKALDAYWCPYSTIDVELSKSVRFRAVNKYPKNLKKQFTLAEVMQITDGLRVKLGQGGYGAVFYGKLSTGQKVAVKRLCWESSQGATEFVNEVELTSRVSHENLVTVIGHCCELNERILIYEYMERGALQDYLYGREAGRETLDWQQRLRIAIDTARGLDYLHTVCKPPIIHRDVKSSNILLDNSFQAKVADFGVSKLMHDNLDLSLGIKGTVGYLDPEYFASQRANDKSDVYGFGIVLLELICGRQALVPSQEDPSNVQNIVDWVNPYLEAKDFDVIIDKSIQRRFDKDAMEQVLDIAIMCVKRNSLSRPTMREILERLNKALSMEIKEKHTRNFHLPKSSKFSISFLNRLFK